MVIDEIIEMVKFLAYSEVPCGECPYKDRCLSMKMPIRHDMWGNPHPVTCEESLGTIIIEELTKLKEQLNLGD